MTVQADQFDAFFSELWNYQPFPWQTRLARQVCNDQWPEYIDLPTASGKTACLDIAVFALAVQAALPVEQRTVGRRIFFVVNRRVIVDEAHYRAEQIKSKLLNADDHSIVGQVANELRQLAGNHNAQPLDTAILRGGIRRDHRWARSLIQPTIITSTVDQVGSRILFRGYGLSDTQRPVNAALVANDSLILLDEAHISKPFAQTIDAVRKYRSDQWAKQTIKLPFHFVQMTATHGTGIDENAIFKLDESDQSSPILAKRQNASKPAKLIDATKLKKPDPIALITENASDMLSDDHRTIAVIVNRVATARSVYEQLTKTQKDQADVVLAIGRMRPYDRDQLASSIESRIKSGAEVDSTAKPLFVVATQCLEVGADYDFDAMVTEVASLDALRQRFGRLNRMGRDIQAKAVIVLTPLPKKASDPIYGEALANTTQWLKENAVNKTIDFSLQAMATHLQSVDLQPLLAPSPNAPVIFPAYIDTWSQTNPVPTPDPEVSLFLHGPQRGDPDIQVCWRFDLPDNRPDADLLSGIISLCPPTTAECMSVPISVFRAWMTDNNDALKEDRGDALEVEPIPTDENDSTRTADPILVWRGLDNSIIAERAKDILPGDTIVLPVHLQGWDIFGHIPNQTNNPIDLDIAEKVMPQTSGRILLRLTPQRISQWPAIPERELIENWINDPNSEITIKQIKQALASISEAMTEANQQLQSFIQSEKPLSYERYPEPCTGIILSTFTAGRHAIADDGDDDISKIKRNKPVPLQTHLEDVVCIATQTIEHLPIQQMKDTILQAAARHDWGKADERFQALLINGDLTDAWSQPTLWAKSANIPLSLSARKQAYDRSQIPKGFRHEMLSVQLSEQDPTLSEMDEMQYQLTLHLIAAHHGYARPFAPVVFDDNPPDVEIHQNNIQLTTEQRSERPAHRIDSGIPERFWSLTREFGWWGLAYLETILKLADWQASDNEDKTVD